MADRARTAATLILVAATAGCISGNRANHTDTGPQVLAGPVIAVRDPADAAAGRKQIVSDLKDQIVTSSNATRNQLSGMVTTSISKLGEKVTGIEASIQSLLHMDLTADVKASLNNQLKATAEMHNSIESLLKVQSTVQGNLESLVRINGELRAQVNGLEASLNALANGQAGIGNKITSSMDRIDSSMRANAGRDVNMFPKQAVDALIASWRTFTAVIAMILALIAAITAYLYRSRRDELHRRYELERARNKATNDLLHHALLHVPPEKAKQILPDQPPAPTT